MAVAGSSLTTGSDTNAGSASSFATASISPTGDALIILAVADSVNQSAPTVTGNGLTWVELGSTTGLRRLRHFRALGASPSSGAVTIDYGAGVPNAVIWSIDEFTGVDTGGTNGSAAVRNYTTNVSAGPATAQSVTLAAFDDAGNGTYGCFHAHGLPTSYTPGTGFTELSDHTVSTPDHTLQTQWRNDNDTSVDATCAASQEYHGAAFEIVAASAGVAVLRRRIEGS